MSDQADLLRQLVRETVKEHPQLQPGVPMVVVSGGKGGVGASTVAIALVRQLAQLGQRAVLVDANPFQPDLATQVGAEVQGCLADVLAGSRSAVEVLQPLGTSVRLLPGRWAASTPPEMNHTAVNRLLTELRALHSHADFVVLDAGSGVSPWVEQLWKAAQQILLVTDCEPVAVMDSYAAVKLAPWGDVDGKVRLVVNRCDDVNFAEQVGQRFAATSRRFLGLQIAETVAISSRAEDNTEGDTFHRSVRQLAAEVISAFHQVASRCSQSRLAPSAKTDHYQKS